MNQRTQDLKFNPYQYTRGIRFKAICEEPKGQIDEKIKAVRKASEQFSQEDLSKLAKLLIDFYKSLNALIFHSDKSDKNLQQDETAKNRIEGRRAEAPSMEKFSDSSDKIQKFKKDLSVSKNWLKRYHKDFFYLLIKKDSNRQKKYSVKELKALHPELSKQLGNGKKYSFEIKEASERKKYSLRRRNDIAENINGLLSREQWSYFDDFLQESHTQNPEQSEKIKKLKEESLKIKDKLQAAGASYLSTQSSGVEIAKAGFNYYTVNKKPKNYENLLKKKKECLNMKPFSKIKVENNHQEKNKTHRIDQEVYKWITYKEEKEIFIFKSRQEKEWIKRYCSKHSFPLREHSFSLSLQQTYDAMKAFKAEQKSIFYEITAHIASKLRESYKVRNKNFLLYGFAFPSDVLNMEGIHREFSFFKFKSLEDDESKDEFNRFINLTKNIKDKKDPKEKSKIARKRGCFLFGKNCYFKGYEVFCGKYKKIAQNRGKINAQIKGLEREQREAKETGFWGLVYCQGNEKQLWLVPKEKMQEARKFLPSEKVQTNYSEKDSGCLCFFESLTMRALRKLCFSEEGSFVREMPDEIKTDLQAAKRIKTIVKREADKSRRKKKDQKKLDFFKKLLESNYAKERLSLKSFNLNEISQVKTLNEFEKNLEEACYHVGKIPFKDEKIKNEFIEKYDVIRLKITSYDLEERNKNLYQTPASENRFHTELWNTFWSNLGKTGKENWIGKFSVGKIRLNPELRIRYRNKDKNLQEYFKKRKFPSAFKHRKLQEQLTINCSLSLNSGKKYEELAFMEPKAILEKINDFNRALNQQKDFKKAWKYGIDRGLKELATLCLVKLDPKGTYQANGKAHFIPQFPNIPCYTFKDFSLMRKYKTSKGEVESPAIWNLSYFANKFDDERYFKRDEIVCLDLTTAKVIKEKIVANGDIMTYLNLKKAVAKRKLYQLFHKGKICQDEALEWGQDGNTNKERSKNVLNINLSDQESGEKSIKPLYYYRKKYEGIPLRKAGKYNQEIVKYSQDAIKAELNSYLNQLDNNNKHIPTILEINHLRDAVTANMAGVICHLQRECPGFIIMEDLGKNTIDKHFFDSEENIARRLENALYSKFQVLGLVPPHVKDIIRLREDIREEQKNRIKRLKNNTGAECLQSSQVGAIVFVPEKNTSRNCPYCGATNERAAKKEEKFRQSRFICNSCDFDTYLFKEERERAEDYNPPVKANIDTNKFGMFQKIDDSDKVAAYNIAKAITCPEEIGEMKLARQNISSEK